jgi:Dolichyl-phosphate-mannose-protein mannosyltransferase
MKTSSHVARVVLLMLGAAGFLGWTASKATIISTDGLRYINQAKELSAGQTFHAIFRAVDHPAYPLSIAVVHQIIGGDTPVDWQRAAQVASVLAGALLVIPLYLLALEMFGASSAWLAVTLSFLVPISAHVMADAMSESLFLLFLFSGVWTAIRFLKDGWFIWLPPTILFAALAFWVRPDALVLPAALVATLGIIPLMRSTRLLWPRWWRAVAFLVIGPACLIAPIIASKGSLATKPAVMRVLGIGPKSAPLAVERQRPLDPNQTTARTYTLATRAMAFAVRDSVTIPLLPLALLGFILSWPPGERGRPWVFLTILMIAWALALIRLHATGGYCTARHAMILTYILIASAAFGLERLITSIAIPGRWIGQTDGRYRLGPIAWIAALIGLIVTYKPEIETPINNQFQGYREAGIYLSANVPHDAKVIDLTGWSLYYGERPGYTFANLIEAMGDPSVSRIIVRDAHLEGKWEYCKQIKQLIGDHTPMTQYPEHPTGKQSIVFVYDWARQAALAAQAAKAEKR